MTRSERGRFLPGVSGNPTGDGGGRPPLPPDLAKVKRLPPTFVEAAITKMLLWGPEEFKAFALAVQEGCAPAGTTMLDVMIASVMQKAVILGDPKYLDFILARTIGKDMAAAPTSEQDALLEKLRSVPIENVVAYLMERKRA